MSGASYFRWANVLTIGSVLLLGWISMGVGILPTEEVHPDLMYLSVIAILFLGWLLSGRTALGMSTTLTAMAVAVVTIVVIALLVGYQNVSSSSTGKIIGLNGFFAILFMVAAMMYRQADRQSS